MTSSQPEHWAQSPHEHVEAAEIARRQGAKPISSVEDMFRPGTFESDEELDEFLADLYASRETGLA